MNIADTEPDMYKFKDLGSEKFKKTGFTTKKAEQTLIH